MSSRSSLLCLSVAVLLTLADGSSLRMLQLPQTALASGIGDFASALSELSRSLQTPQAEPRSDWAVRLQGKPVTAEKPLIGILSQVPAAGPLPHPGSVLICDHDPSCVQPLMYCSV